MISREEMFLGPSAHLLATILATTRAYLKRFSTYTIQMVRWPLGPLLIFASWRVTYGVSGRTSVEGASPSAFLLVGIFGYIVWTSSLWASGYAIEFERDEGTSGALFLSPASRAAVVVGYGLGSLVWFLPSFATVLLLALVTGARLSIADPAAVLAGAAVLVLSSLSVGFVLAGLFILSRRGNLIANFLQWPIELLGGLIVPLSLLPSGLVPLSEALPPTHAIIALRESALLAGSLSHVAPQIALGLVLSAVYWLVGLIMLRRVENVAKRHGQLDLY